MDARPWKSARQRILDAPSVGFFEKTRRDEVDDLFVRHERERPRRWDIGVKRSLGDSLRIASTFLGLHLGALSEGPNLLDEPPSLLLGVHLPGLLPADEVVAVMVKRSRKLVIRDDGGIEDDVE